MSKEWRVYFSKRMIVAFFMGFSSGLPLLLLGSTLQAWMTDNGVDLGVIGLFSLTGLPFTYKFVWAPAMDRFVPPFLGRRRGWLLVTQVLIACVLVLMSGTDPARSTWVMAFLAVCLAFSSASQDIVADAYRRESLSDEELGYGSSLFVTGYRVGMLAAGAGALTAASLVSWQLTYLIMACCVTVGIVTTLLADEPKVEAPPPRTLKEAVVEPFMEFFNRNGVKSALVLLGFMLLFKIGDSMASAMTTPFILNTGYTKAEFAWVGKAFGMASTIGGGIIGGVVILKIGMNRCLWVFGALQAVSTLGFVLIDILPRSLAVLAPVIAFENLSSGMGTAAFVGFMGSITNKRFTATQYALLSSLISVPRVLASAPTGYLVKAVGWTPFFVICTLVAIPGMLLLLRFAPWSGGRPKVAADATAEAGV